MQAAILPSLGQWTFENMLELPSSRLQETPWLVFIHQGQGQLSGYHDSWLCMLFNLRLNWEPVDT